jgi:hypothetical protein
MAVIIKYHRLVGLHNKILFPHKCWIYKVWYLQSSANGCLLSVLSHGNFSVFLCSNLIFFKGHYSCWIGPSWRQHFNLIHLLKSLISKYSHILRYWSLEIQHMNRGYIIYLIEEIMIHVLGAFLILSQSKSSERMILKHQYIHHKINIFDLII